MAEATVSQPKTITSRWTGWHTVCLLAIILVITLSGLLIPASARVWSWILCVVLLLLFATVAGQGITGRWNGLLIDERNKMSLSRLQMILWTVVVVSGFLAAALSNIAAGAAGPLSISVPTELWMLMGISTTSLVGSPLIKNAKAAKPAHQGEMSSTLGQMANQMGVRDLAGSVTNKGQVIVNTSPEAARWSDMFKGEETGNAALLDLGKVQMFYFTLILVLAYAVALGSGFAVRETIHAFPALDSSMVALLGISHAGYLVHKAVPHSQAA